MKNITTLLFDIDGTLLDTRDFIINAAEHALAKFGYDVPKRSVIAQSVGKTFPDFYATLTGSSKNIDELLTTHRDFQLKNLHLSKVFLNSLEVLSYLKKKGYRMGAVTSRSKITSHQTLKDAGISHFFDVVISAEDTEKLKPNPDPLLKALKHFSETPDKAVMIGDSHFDIEAGKNAGTKTIRAVYGFHTDNLENPKPDFVISDIKDLLKLL